MIENGEILKPEESGLHVSSPEVQRLLNPAFCAAVLTRTAAAFQRVQSHQGLPYASSFLVLPLVLHMRTRSAILSHSNGFSLHRFVRTHPEILAGLDSRVSSLAPFTRRALLFGYTQGGFEFDLNQKCLRVNLAMAKKVTPEKLGTATADSLRAADRIGTWLAGVSVSQTYIFLQLIP